LTRLERLFAKTRFHVRRVQDLEIGDPTKFFAEIAGDDGTITAQERYPTYAQVTVQHMGGTIAAAPLQRVRSCLGACVFSVHLFGLWTWLPRLGLETL
jgi:hypothetical protein